MKNSLTALFVSLFVHLLLALGLVLVARVAVTMDELPKLDVSSVELSLSESDVPTEAPTKSEMTDVQPRPIRPSRLEAPKAPPSPDRAAPPIPPSHEFAELDEAQVEMVTPIQQQSKSESVPAPDQAKVVVPPELKNETGFRPRYPKLSRQRGEEGLVVVELHVSALGEVAQVKLVVESPFKALNQAALDAARKLTFKPALSAGNPVDFDLPLKYVFRLKGK